MIKIGTPEFDALSPEEKQKVIFQHKLRFVKKVAIGIVILAALIAGGVFALKIRKDMIEDRRRFVVNPPSEPIVTKPIDEPEGEKEYSNTTLQVSFKYPAEATLTETFDSEKGEGKVEVVYSKDNSPEFEQGYKVSITVFSTKTRELSQFATTRLEAMKITCPESATYSRLSEGKMAEYGSLNYTIEYCDGFYRNYYIDFGGKYFEISRYYKGDIGYRQQYEIITNEVIKTITLLPQRFEITEFLKSVSDKDTGVKFEYPTNYIDKCSVPMPTDTKYRVILSMCPEEQPETGVIIGMTQLPQGSTFESFVETERNKMDDDFFAAKGHPSDAEPETAEFRGRPAIKLNGFSWQDASYTFVYSTYKERPFVLMMGTKVGSPEYKTEIETILNSIDFGE